MIGRETFNILKVTSASWRTGYDIISNPSSFCVAVILQNILFIDLDGFFLTPPQDAGADCAKFQKSELEHKFNKRALERPYNSKNSWGKTYGEHKRHLEFSHEQYRELQRFAADVGIFFTASGMDEVNVSSWGVVRLSADVWPSVFWQMAVEFLHEINVPFFKVGSGDTNNFPYLEKTAKKGRELRPL